MYRCVCMHYVDNFRTYLWPSSVRWNASARPPICALCVDIDRRPSDTRKSVSLFFAPSCWRLQPGRSCTRFSAVTWSSLSAFVIARLVADGGGNTRLPMPILLLQLASLADRRRPRYAFGGNLGGCREGPSFRRFHRFRSAHRRTVASSTRWRSAVMVIGFLNHSESRRNGTAMYSPRYQTSTEPLIIRAPTRSM